MTTLFFDRPLIAGLAAVLTTAVLSLTNAPAAHASDNPTPLTIPLWPGGAPDEPAGIGPEHDTSTPTSGATGGKPVIRLGDVTVPTITVYRPAANLETGTAVVVCPGGGYNILAMDLEGTEVCDYLNSIGVTAVLLKYRVPRRAGREMYAAPLQDAQRAIGIVRSKAKEWNLRPDRIGVLGFSAGGHLSAAVSTNHDKRTYTTVDDSDTASCRPDFTVLIYPAYLTKPDGSMQLTPEIRVDSKTPPAFLAQTEDDPIHVESSLVYYLALKNAHVPAEMHLYPNGGHGYGMRPTDSPITSAWPRLLEAWLLSSGFVGAPKASK